MNFSFRKTTALMLSLLLIVSGCSATERLNKAAATKGQAAVGIALPPLPDDLRRQEAHAPVAEGEPVIAILARERQALDRANARQGRTIRFYTDLTSRFGTRR
jgi:hypothetical protein